MSLITCCPDCGTMFKVVPDQLRISEGWVRCGHCSQVFDAPAHMLPHGVPVEAARATQGGHEIPASPPPPVHDTQPQPLAPLPPAASPPDPEPMSDEDRVSEAERVWSVNSLYSDDGQSTWEPGGTSIPDPEPIDLEAPPAPQPTIVATPRKAIRTEAADSAMDSENPDSRAHDTVSFVRDARRREFWKRPLVRAMLFFVCLGLLGALALQFALQERDRIAALRPDFKPYLEQLCEHAQCRIGPPRQIESILIDSSSFNRLRPDAYRLSFTLRNNAPMEVAVPAMELTLTDTQDQPVLRRVLTPADLGAAGPVLAPAADWSGSVALGVPGNGGARIAGYRLLAFYP